MLDLVGRHHFHVGALRKRRPLRGRREGVVFRLVEMRTGCDLLLGRQPGRRRGLHRGGGEHGPRVAGGEDVVRAVADLAVGQKRAQNVGVGLRRAFRAVGDDLLQYLGVRHARVAERLARRQQLGVSQREAVLEAERQAGLARLERTAQDRAGVLALAGCGVVRAVQDQRRHGLERVAALQRLRRRHGSARIVDEAHGFGDREALLLMVDLHRGSAEREGRRDVRRQLLLGRRENGLGHRLAGAGGRAVRVHGVKAGGPHERLGQVSVGVARRRNDVRGGRHRLRRRRLTRDLRRAARRERQALLRFLRRPRLGRLLLF